MIIAIFGCQQLDELEISSSIRDPHYRTSYQLNTPFNNPTTEKPTAIKVTDPTHPLYGCSFPESNPHQVLSNQESLYLQYALKERALNLGWRSEDIEVIDSDLRQTAASAHHREGIKEIASKVALGKAGIILSYLLDRLSRNCSDSFPLLDVCAYRNCLIGDRDNIYDPGSPNGRLLLGIKGQLSEMELHAIRAHMTAGLLNKAQRGELALKLPVGLIRDENENAVKDPDTEVQERLQLIFTTFLRVKSASKVLRFLNDHDLPPFPAVTVSAIWYGKSLLLLLYFPLSKTQPTQVILSMAAPDQLVKVHLLLIPHRNACRSKSGEPASKTSILLISAGKSLREYS